MAKFSEEDDKLIAELGIEYEVKKKPALSAKEERVIAGFEEIQKFVEEQNREPSFVHEKDIFERLYATRLEQIRKQPDCVELLKDSDYQDLLNETFLSNISEEEDLDDEALLGELGFNTKTDNDLTSLRHVKPRSEIKPADEVGTRTACKDFHVFKPLFEKIQSDIESGVRKIIPFVKDGTIEKENLFILGGQKVYVADIGEMFIGTDGRKEYRLRIIFDNGVESNQLMRSLQKRLWEDEGGRRITDISMGPLFDDQPDEGDIASGVIYVCRSQSSHPLIRDNSKNVHKIGVTSKDPSIRLSGAEGDPTFLFAKADLVASFELYNINRHKLETLLHKVFASARLEIEIPDRFGKTYRPKEWFCVPVETIQKAVDKLKNGTLLNYGFNVGSGDLEKKDVIENESCQTFFVEITNYMHSQIRIEYKDSLLVMSEGFPTIHESGPPFKFKPTRQAWNNFQEKFNYLKLKPKSNRDVCDGFGVDCKIIFPDKKLRFNLPNPDFDGFEELMQLINSLTKCKEYPNGFISNEINS